MNKPITPELIQKWEEISNLAAFIESQITDRITYVLNLWFEAFDDELDTWYFSNAAEGDVGKMEIYEGQIVYLILESVHKEAINQSIIDKDGKIFCLTDSIPLRWLFDENVKQEIEDGKKLFEQKQKEKLEKKQKRKIVKQQLIESAKKKLTKEELNVLLKGKI